MSSQIPAGVPAALTKAALSNVQEVAFHQTLAAAGTAHAGWMLACWPWMAWSGAIRALDRQWHERR